MILGIMTVSVISVMLVYHQEIQLATGIIARDNYEHEPVKDPLCFTISNNTRGELCYPLDVLSEYGCSKPILEHLAVYSNLIDYEWHDMFFIEWISLPKGMSEKNFDECVEFLADQRTDPTDTRPISLSHPLTDYAGTECSSLNMLDKACFIEAFTACTKAMVSYTITTIEGDPITTFAYVNSTNPDMCKIDVYHDTTHDRYSNQTIDYHSCSLLIESGDSLQVTKCIPLEHEQEQIFEFR